jgi:hypothetical protein
MCIDGPAWTKSKLADAVFNQQKRAMLIGMVTLEEL